MGYVKMFVSVNTGRPSMIPQYLAIGVQIVRGNPRILTHIIYRLCSNCNTDNVKRHDSCAQILEKLLTTTRLRDLFGDVAFLLSKRRVWGS